MSEPRTSGRPQVSSRAKPPSPAWREAANFAGGVLLLALAVWLFLDAAIDDELVVLGVPVLIGCAALWHGAKAWRLWRIRHWAAGKEALAGELSAISGSVARMHGITTEQKALRRLKLPNGWQAHPNVAYGHGDIDLVVLTPDRSTAFACEIKSWAGLTRRGSLFGPARLVKRDGREPDSDPVEQTLKQARALLATRRYPRVVPVLWLPNGRARTFHHAGVTIVNGGPRRLRRALGAGFW
jgi:hypothetical protein